jgi:hypothetical protein
VFFIPGLFSFFENQIDFGARSHPQRHIFTPAWRGWSGDQPNRSIAGTVHRLRL